MSQMPSDVFRVGSLELVADAGQYRRRDRVLPIIANEQPVICEWLQVQSGDRVLDAGTGCGVLALHAALKGAQATGIDISPRAIATAESNAKRNRLSVKWLCEDYSVRSASEASVDIVVFNPPHNPTPSGVDVPMHADGGEDGTRVFAKFLRAAAKHVVPGGTIVFFQLSPARSGIPQICEECVQAMPHGFSLRFARVLPTTSNRGFLEAVYGGRYGRWVERMTAIYPDLDLVVGRVIAHLPGNIEEVRLLPAAVGTRAERVLTHQQIVGTV